MPQPWEMNWPAEAPATTAAAPWEMGWKKNENGTRWVGYGENYEELRKEAGAQLERGLAGLANINEPAGPRVGPFPTPGNKLDAAVVDTVLGGAGYVFSPINAGLRTVIGKPLENITGIPKEWTEFAAALALPVPKRIPTLSPARPAASAPLPPQQLGVTLSQGQATRELPLIQREQAALRGASGPPAQKAAQAFAEQQQRELAATRESITQSLDPGAQVVAEDPQAAAALVQQSVQKTAAMRKADVDAAYAAARARPGEIHAAAFESMPQQIKGDLSLGAEPIIIDDKLTPFASRAIQDIEDRVGQLRIQNRADPFGQPNPENIVGIDLKGVDQMRKRLSTFRRDAFSSGNGADGRAAQAVLNAFDARIDAAVNGGLFSGDQAAIKAWNAARAAYSDYRGTFAAGKNDPIGRVVEKIIGKGNNPAAIPNDVADFMYGAAGVNPSSVNVGVTKRLRDILGEHSPEWSAVRQGLFHRIVDAGEGMTDFGAGKVAQRLNRFLNSDGKEMAALLYSPAERDLLQKYADLMRQLEIPQAGANWSNTAAFAGAGFKPSMGSRALNAIGSNVGMVISGLLGHAGGALAGVPFGGEVAGAAAAKIGGMSAQAKEARIIAKQMPIIANVTKSFQAAAAAYETSPTARNVARLTLASRNLVNNLKDAGITLSPENLLRSIQGPVSAGAEGEQR